MGESKRLTKAQIEAADFCQEVCERADAMGISLVAFPVPEVRELIAAVRRAALTPESTHDQP